MYTYKATNTTNGKFYIGSSFDFERRKVEHMQCNKNYPFQNALRKKPGAFDWEVWTDDSDEPILEQALLDMWYGCEQCYNLNPSASRPPSWEGKKHKESTKQKQSASQVKDWEQNTERRKKASEAASRRVQTKESRDKISANRRGKVTGDANPSKRPEVREKISASKTGKPNPTLRLRNLQDNPAKRKEVREKMSLANLGKKHWINEQGERKYQAESPGPEWQNGRTWRG
jgi:group I intron endonuclease